MRARAFKEEIKFYLKKKGRVCFEIKILKIKSYHKPSFICSALFIKVLRRLKLLFMFI